MSSDITRSEAIKTLKEHLSHWERLLQEHICEEQEGIDTISALKLAIASLETDEAYQLEYERTAGHWNEIPKYKDIAWLCSECGHFTTMKHNYCPNCGCHMVEPQESEDKE